MSNELRSALSGLLEYCAENNPCQGDPERDDPRVTQAFAALAQAEQAQPVAPVVVDSAAYEFEFNGCTFAATQERP